MTAALHCRVAELQAAVLSPGREQMGQGQKRAPNQRQKKKKKKKKKKRKEKKKKRKSEITTAHAVVKV
jgi:hypothetical protein